MSPGRVALHGRAATQVANSAAPGRAPRPATAPVSRSWTAAAIPGLHALAVRAVLDAAIAAGIPGEVMSGACAAAAGFYAHQGVTAKSSWAATLWSCLSFVHNVAPAISRTAASK